MSKIITYIILLIVISNYIRGQEISDIKLNHLSFVLEYSDSKAFRESSFIKDSLGFIKTTVTDIDSANSFTRSFLHSESTYLEIFETSEDDTTLGFLTIAFGIDQAKGLPELAEYFKRYYVVPPIRSYTRDHDGVAVPWFESLVVIDTNIVNDQYAKQSHFWFWIMNYKTEYFKHNGYKIENGKLTRENYLEKYTEDRKDKIIKNFAGIGMKLNPEEKKLLTRFFDNIGYTKINENEYLSKDNFKYQIAERQAAERYSVEYIEFETSQDFQIKKEVDISNHISISLQGNKGQIRIME
jgi:hypothetical protein